MDFEKELEMENKAIESLQAQIKNLEADIQQKERIMREMIQNINRRISRTFYLEGQINNALATDGESQGGEL